MGALTHDMSPGEIMAIYPEGTRPTHKNPAGQEVIAEATRDRSRWRPGSTLPPAPGGRWHDLDEAANGIDIVFCGHVGFEGLGARSAT